MNDTKKNTGIYMFFSNDLNQEGDMKKTVKNHGKDTKKTKVGERPESYPHDGIVS